MRAYTYYILLSVFTLGSCDKYLDVSPKGVQLLETVRDYDLWLNNSELQTSVPSLLNTLDDTKDIPTIPAILTSTTDRVYTWQEQFSEVVPGTAEIWQTCYKSIYLYNTVINNIDKASGGTDEDRRSLKAEALLGRAFEYLYLVNLYAKVYDPTTAKTDLAIPIVTSIDVTDLVPNRSVVQDVYDLIQRDIMTALDDLPKDNAKNRFRGSTAAAYGILARTYLYMGDYEKAYYHAQKALESGPNTVADYRPMTNSKSIIELIRRPDAMYARFGGHSNLAREIPTQAFLKTFNTKDLRLKFFYTLLGDYSFSIRGRTVFVHSGVVPGAGAPNWGISVAEMYLIKAEAAARAGDLSEACNELDQVRKVRFMPEDYVKYSSTDQEDVLKKVLSERTFELAYSGLRWFDMRRLDKEGRMPAVHRYNGLGDVIATLNPGSIRYTLQIPEQVLFYNEHWQQNP